MTIKNALKKHLQTVREEQPTTKADEIATEKMQALLQAVGRDLLSVADFEEIFGVSLEERR